MRHRRVLVPIGIVAVAVSAWLAFGYFAVQDLFIDDTVDEAAPEFATATSAPGAAGGTDDDRTASSIAELAPYRGTFVDRSHPTTGTALVLQGAGSGERVLRFEDFETDNGPDLNVYLSSAPADAAASAFDDDFIDLGNLKGNIGNQNYDVPLDADLDKYSTVVVWCVRFRVAFGAADLSPA